MIQAGDTPNQQIADTFGVSIHTVYSWKERLRHQGGLEATPTTGRPSRLTSEQRQQLCTLLQEGARAHHFPDETWTTPRVRDLVGRQLGVWYHVDHVRKLLHQLGFSLQRPQKGALEQNEQAVRTWVQTTRPEVKKNYDGKLDLISHFGRWPDGTNALQLTGKKCCAAKPHAARYVTARPG